MVICWWDNSMYSCVIYHGSCLLNMFHARARQDSGSHISGHNSPAARADRSGLSKRLKNTVLKPFVVQKQYQHCQCVVFFARFTGENFVRRRPPDHRLRFLRRIFYEKLQN